MDNPIETVENIFSSTTGALHTDEYYARIYENQQNGVPTQTLILDAGNGGVAQPQTGYVQSNPQSDNIQRGYTEYGGYPQQTAHTVPTSGGSVIDDFLRTTVPLEQSPTQEGGVAAPTVQSKEQNTVPIYTPTTQGSQNQYTQSIGVAPKTAVDVSPVSVFSFVVQAAFSIAVVISVMGIMFVIYIMIRTRQLHHHEHHVKELGKPDAHAGHGAAHGEKGEKGEKKHGAHTEDHVSSTAHDIHDEAHSEEEDRAAHDEEHGEAEQGLHSESAKDVALHGGESHDANTHEEPRAKVIHQEELSDFVPTPPVSEMDTDEANLFSSRLKTIRADAESDDDDSWYTALMDINLLLEDILSEKGFEGTSVKEMLASDQGKELATKDVALEAEAQFQKLISGEESLTKDAITHLVNMYAKVCKELGVV